MTAIKDALIYRMPKPKRRDRDCYQVEAWIAPRDTWRLVVPEADAEIVLRNALLRWESTRDCQMLEVQVRSDTIRDCDQDLIYLAALEVAVLSVRDDFPAGARTVVGYLANPALRPLDLDPDSLDPDSSFWPPPVWSEFPAADRLRPSRIAVLAMLRLTPELLTDE